MCGIAGAFKRQRDGSPAVDRGLLQRMADVQAHRGPDGDGFATGDGWALAHRRLSIVDLAGGRQPMADAEDAAAARVWVTYNGEIYNFASLRTELEAAGYVFRTNCDTEVLVHGWRHWGESLPTKLRGMFAFAVVDLAEHVLFAARDRLGKKPLHWTLVDDGSRLLFASELKGLLVHPEVAARDLDPDALAQFLCLRYIPDPRTVFAGVHKLPPGSTLTVRNGRVDVKRYWSLSFAPDRPRSLADRTDEVLSTFDEAVSMRLMSDVPLGAFLSGGIDSYAVVESMARALGDRPVIACTMGFEDPDLDERPLARRAAEACGAILHEGVVDPSAMLDQQWLVDTFDEPFADGSAVPTYHVSALARRHVTVALSGDGGDESFAGYRRYKFDAVENRIRSWLPRGIWTACGALYPKADFLPRWLRFKRTFQNLARDPALAYARSVSANLPEQIVPLLRSSVRPGGDPLGPVLEAYAAADGPDALSRAAACDFSTWLPGDILVKVDRASMATSLEVRAPFLDHVLVEAAAKIPSALKLENGETKGLLRRILGERLGGGLDARGKGALSRPKQGFHVPLRTWFRGPMGDALERDLGRGDAELASYVDVDVVRRRLNEHRTGTSDHGELLWALLSLQRFLTRWRAREVAA